MVRAALPAPTSAFDIPPAPILIPEGPWKEVEGSVNAAKGFKAQGNRDISFHTALQTAPITSDIFVEQITYNVSLIASRHWC